MLPLLVVLGVAVTVALVVLLVAQLVPDRTQPVQQRLSELTVDRLGGVARRRREARRERLAAMLQEIGSQFEERYQRASDTRRFLMQAGYRSDAANAVYWGSRLALGVGLGVTAFAVGTALGAPATLTLLGAIYFGAMGWIFPLIVVRGKVKARQREIRKALPDVLDLMVVCVEAGLGLNQAFVRVGLETSNLSPAMSEELAIANLEIQAGKSREDALRNMAERTGLEDVRSFVTMLVQTDRFGTSIAKSLRIHAETLRTKRRQRAEEAAAKTAIKMVFPLVICIFPALFVVIIGPGLLSIFDTLGSL